MGGLKCTLILKGQSDIYSESPFNVSDLFVDVGSFYGNQRHTTRHLDGQCNCYIHVPQCYILNVTCCYVRPALWSPDQQLPTLLHGLFCNLK